MTTDPEFNKNFISACLEKAAKKAKSSLNLRDMGVEIVFDRDTKDIPGTPAIFGSIEEKISNADIFIADLSIINNPTNNHKNIFQRIIQWLNNWVNPPINDRMMKLCLGYFFKRTLNSSISTSKLSLLSKTIIS
ncbi:MAG: hypothetical protein NTW54_09615 [Bacteroidetes bacterium]|nr:hypothetical protein [Bacteroidota bacterium]